MLLLQQRYPIFFYYLFPSRFKLSRGLETYLHYLYSSNIIRYELKYHFISEK